MPEIDLSRDARLFYDDNDFTDPWVDAEAVMMLHGFAENGRIWNAWVPQLARRFCVVRPDMRGFGLSTPMPVDHRWSVDEVVADYLLLADRLGLERFHLVGSKVGGAIATRIAARYPDRVRTLTVNGSTFVSGKGARADSNPAARRAQYEREGVEAWARTFVPGRLGRDCPPEMIEGWIKLLGATPLSTAVGFITAKDGVPSIDVGDDLRRLACPLLVIITQEGGTTLADATRERLRDVPGSELVVLPGDSIHPAASYPDACLSAMFDFVERSAAGA